MALGRGLGSSSSACPQPCLTTSPPPDAPWQCRRPVTWFAQHYHSDCDAGQAALARGDEVAMQANRFPPSDPFTATGAWRAQHAAASAPGRRNGPELEDAADVCAS